MAALNGVATSAATVIEDGLLAAADGLAMKRKHDENENAQLDTVESTRQQQAQRDILSVLQQHDTEPSFLEYRFDSDHGMRSLPKKPKLLETTTKMTSLRSKLQNGAYVSLQFFMQDVLHVKQEIVESLRTKGKQSGSDRMSVEDLKQIQRLHGFEALVQDVVENEYGLQAAHESERAKSADLTKQDGPSRIGTVLTLFGNAPTPKQLFSSMQHMSRSPVQKFELPVEEMSLPNGLTATKIMTPVVDQSRKEPTFEEAFPPPYNLAPLHPPKAHKRSSTRDSTITWEFKDVIGRGGKKHGYTAQTVTVGNWLSYGGKGASQSSMERQKQRERALSGGHGNKTIIQNDSDEDLAREEEALFRRAYSSFAPSYDNSKALVSEETKSMLWWQKTGQARFNEIFAIDPALLGEIPVSDARPEALHVSPDKVESDDFAAVVGELEAMDEETLDVKQVHSKTDVDQVLNDIAELLGKMASHQRIRNSSLPSSTSGPRPPISPAPTLNTRSGRPDEPSDDEAATYHTLKRELCYLVLKLPPYAIAKLDGQQFSALGVGKLITFQPTIIRGTMEEDQVARLARHNSIATATSIASLTRATSSTSAQHYNTTAQRTPAIGQAANTRYGASNIPAAQPQYQRSTSHQSQYGTPGSKYGPSGQYSKYRATGSAQPSSYTPSATQQYYRPQPTPGGYAGYGQQYGQQGTPQTQPTYSSQPLAQFQQRSQAAAFKSSTQTQSQSPLPRTGSPAKSDYGSQHQQPLAQRATYSAQAGQYPQQQPGSGRATPVYASSQPHTPVNGFSQPPSQQQRALPQAVAPRPASTTPQPQVNGHT